MRPTVAGWFLAGLVILSSGAVAQPRGQFDFRKHYEKSFQRIATLPNYLNNPDIADETVSEIVAATKNGKTLVYTDSARQTVGFVDISDSYNPRPDGTLAVGGEPTSVAVLRNQWALVAANTSESFLNPSGRLVVIKIKTRQIEAVIPLGGQPDSIAISPNGKYAAIAIENERDEDIVVDGVEGGLPQLPAGFLVIVDIQGRKPKNWTLRTVDLTGLSAYAPSDPEPEFVDINDRDEAVVTLQENNHIAVVDLRTGAVVKHFGAGAVTLHGVDTTEDGVISLTESLDDVAREPDAVTWLPHRLIATANEGDLFGGSRGFSIFDRKGNVRFDSGAAVEKLAVRYGHYPEDRSENKGTEPESIEFANFKGADYLFLGSERGSFVAVYKLHRARPELVQLLPGPLGPEGLLAIPARDLLVVSGEVDAPPFGVRSAMMIYKRKSGKPTHPQILSADNAVGSPIPWSAMSGMTAVPGSQNTLLAVWDSFYSESNIFTIDISKKPAVVTEAIAIQGGSGNYDPEGIAVAPDGTYWIASEGNASGSRLNRLLQTNAMGIVLAEIGLPAAIEACRAASENRGSLGAGFEGVAVLPTSEGYKLLVAQQRGWDYTTDECEDLDDDPTGANQGEPPQTRIWIYDPASGSWEHTSYALEPVPANASWVGLSEITQVGDGSYIFVERDNRSGDFAALKTLVKMQPEAGADGIISRSEKAVFDLMPDLKATNGWITDKPEGVAVTQDGRVFVITDNDGVSDWSGESWFLKLGRVRRLFR